MKTFKGIVIGMILGVALTIGALYQTGHMTNNYKQVSYTIDTMAFDGISFK